MGRMKELLMTHVDNISWEKYDNEYYLLIKEQQDEVWELAQQAANDYLAGLADRERDRRKEGELNGI